MVLFFAGFSILYSCDGNNPQQENDDEDLEIGKETGGMGTGPGPGVDVPLDTAEKIEPDKVVVE